MKLHLYISTSNSRPIPYYGLLSKFYIERHMRLLYLHSVWVLALANASWSLDFHFGIMLQHIELMSSGLEKGLEQIASLRLLQTSRTIFEHLD